MKGYHRLLQRQLKKIALDESTVNKLGALLEQINKAYHSFDNDLYQAETILEKSSQELFLANKQLTNNIATISSRLTKVAGNIKEVIFEMDLNGKWNYLNPAWEELIGHKIDECLDKPFYKHLEIIEGKPLKKLLLVKKPKFDSFSEIIKIKTKNNQEKWLDFSLKVVKCDKGICVGYIGTIVDISNLKQTELELLKAKEKETLANKAKDDFLSTMSHEIRTPLNAVIGISHLLLLENPKNEQLENLQALKYSSEHLLGLVNDILDFNKIASGSLDLEQMDFSMDNLLNGIHSIFQNKAKAKNIRFTIKKDNSLPDMLVGDSIRISQILTNLVNNAIKFTEKGKVTLDIEVVSDTKDTCLLEIGVKDTGIGIPEEKQEKIFHSFAQANSDTTRKYGGTGLGLAICKQLLEIMGTSLRVDSEVDKGSTFSFLLNLKKGEKVNPHIDKNAMIETDGLELHDLSGVKILVAEDNKVNIMVIKKFLDNWKVDFTIAENGLIALEYAKKVSYDLILMDLQMPVMNGFDSCKLIRESRDSINKDIPIYALSASTGMDIKNEIKEFKMNGLICKPFNPSDLFQKLSDIITNSKMANQDLINN